jgi:tetratricopeptide (TPR) repeat protein
MMKAFLSHSSRDKESYVRVVANRLGTERAIFDEVTFEEGMQTFDEIHKNLDQSDLFVLFISDAALSSAWVKMELEAAFSLLRDGNLQRLFPIIIDPNVTYADPRLPDWMRREYNLKYIGQPTVAARRIEHQLRELSWQLHPRLQQRERIFVGRNELIKLFEERMDAIGRPTPVCLIAAGIKGVGRKALLRNCLKKSNIVPEGYQPPSISLSNDESIEDFLQRLYDLGLSKTIDLSGLLARPVSEKAKLGAELLRDIARAREVVFVMDNDCIVTHDGIVPWFGQLLQEIRAIERPVLGIAAKNRLFSRNRPSSDSVLTLQVPELETAERGGLLKRYADFIQVDLSVQDLRFLADLLTGLPEQVFYTVDLIEEQGIGAVKKNSVQIVEFTTQRILTVLNEVERDEQAIDFLALLAEFDFVSEEMVFKIAGDTEENRRRVARFFSLAICEPLGAAREYLRLNDAVRDYVQRSYSLPDTYKDRLNEHLSEFLKDYSPDERDAGDVLYSVRAALLRGELVESKYLIPSHFLKTIKELYDNEQRSVQVITLADRALQSSLYMDPAIESEIRTFLCLALARRRDARFFAELKKIPLISDSDAQFLQGFFQRHVGNLVRAIEHFQSALVARRNFSRAKNELARILIQLEDFDTALPLAASSYDGAPHNTYFIRTYFEALVRVAHSKERGEMLRKLLDQLRRFTVKHADEMFLNAQAQYAAFYERNFDHAIALLDEAGNIADNPAYHLFTKLQIYRAARRKREMRQVLVELRQRGITEDSHWGTRLLRMQAIMHAMEGRGDQALGIANMKLTAKQPAALHSAFIDELRRILADSKNPGRRH